MRTSGKPSGPPDHSLLRAIALFPVTPPPVVAPFVAVDVDVPFVLLLMLEFEDAADVLDLGILARRRTSVNNSGNVSQVPLRKSSRESARTRSVQPVRASESARMSERSEIWPVARRWAMSACEVSGGSEVDVEVRDVGVGIWICGGSDMVVGGNEGWESRVL